MVVCKCGREIMKAYPTGKAKVRSAILIVKADGSVMAVCEKCKTEIDVPLQCNQEIPKPSAKLYIKL